MGNVWEWTCSDAFQYPGSTAEIDPTRKVVKGGCFSSLKYEARCSSRPQALPDWKTDRIGFRCARSAITGEDPIRRIIKDCKYLFPRDGDVDSSLTVGVEKLDVDREAKIITDSKTIALCPREKLKNVAKNAVENEAKKEKLFLGVFHTDVNIGYPILSEGDYLIYLQAPTEENGKKKGAKAEKKEEQKKDSKKKSSKKTNGKKKSAKNAKKKAEEPEQEQEEAKEKEEEKGLSKFTPIWRITFEDKSGIIWGEITSPVLYNETQERGSKTKGMSAVFIGPEGRNLLFKVAVPAPFGPKRLMVLFPLDDVKGGVKGFCH
jgi:hypothetical protein